MMVGGTFRSNGPSDGRPWTFYALATLFATYLLFLYGPMLVIYVLSFQGPNGGVTFPMVGTSLAWFRDVFKPGQMANLPVSFGRSIELATLVSCADGGVLGLGGAWVSATVSGVGRAVLLCGCQPGDAKPAGGVWYRSWVSVFGLADEPVHFGARGATDLDIAVRPVRHVCRGQPVQSRLGGSGRRSRGEPWQRLRYVTIPILLPGIIGVAMGAFTLSYDEYARTTLAIGPQQYVAAGNLRLDLQCDVAGAICYRYADHVGVVPDHSSTLRWSGECSDVARSALGRRLTMDARFDVELVAVTKRYGTTCGGSFRCAFRRRVLLPARTQRMRQDHDSAHDRRA